MPVSTYQRPPAARRSAPRRPSEVRIVLKPLPGGRDFRLIPPRHGSVSRRPGTLATPACGATLPMHRDPARVIADDAAAVASRLPALGDASVLLTGSSAMLDTYLVAILQAAGARLSVATRSGGRLILPPDPVQHIIVTGADIDAFRKDPAAALAAETATLAQLLERARRDYSDVTFVSSALAAQSADPLDPGGYFETAKRAGEALCAASRREHGVPTSIIRLAFLYGPGFDLGSDEPWAELTRAAGGGSAVVVHTNDQRRLPWTYIADAADAVLRTALTAPTRNATVAFSATDERSRRDIRAFARTALAEAGRPPALAFELTSPDHLLAQTPQPTAASALPPGWKPRTGLRDGVQRTVRWYRDAAHAAAVQTMVGAQ